MIQDYFTTDRQTAYDLISDAGGPIRLYYNPDEQSAGPPADPQYPWQGNDLPLPFVEHIAAIIPYEGINAGARPFATQALIPGLNLTILVTKDMLFQDLLGTVYQIKEFQELNPNMSKEVILYTCEIISWPQSRLLMPGTS